VVRTGFSLMRHILISAAVLVAGAVGVVIVGRVDETVWAPGEIQPATALPVAPQIPGRVRAVHVEEGDTVQADQPLLSLDDRDLLATLAELQKELDELKAGLEQAQGDSARLRACLRPQQLSQAHAALSRAAMARDFAAADLERITQLHEGRCVPLTDVRLKRREFDMAAAQLTESEAAAALVRARLAQEAAEIDGRLATARCRIATAHARIENLQAHIDAATLRAPIAGTIITSHPERLVGLWLAEGQPAVEIANLDSLEFVSNLQPRDEHRIQPGLAAHIHLDAYPQREYQMLVGVVARTAAYPIPRDGASLFPAVISIEDPWIVSDHAERIRLKPGLGGRAEIVVRPKVRLARLLVEGIWKSGG
jgi:HlyD family secretion protein